MLGDLHECLTFTALCFLTLTCNYILLLKPVGEFRVDEIEDQ
jgi:hypothetical protein